MIRRPFNARARPPLAVRVAVFATMLLTAGVASDLPGPLTDVAGDPARGRAIVLDRERGHCVLCHQVAQLDAPFQGNIGPPLDTVGERLGAAAMRQRIIDPTALNPNSAMPAYYRTEGLRQVATEWRGRPVLDAQEVEDVVAYLQTLRSETNDH